MWVILLIVLLILKILVGDLGNLSMYVVMGNFVPVKFTITLFITTFVFLSTFVQFVNREYSAYFYKSHYHYLECNPYFLQQTGCMIACVCVFLPWIMIPPAILLQVGIILFRLAWFASGCGVPPNPLELDYKRVTDRNLLWWKVLLEQWLDMTDAEREGACFPDFDNYAFLMEEM